MKISAHVPDTVTLSLSQFWSWFGSAELLVKRTLDSISQSHGTSVKLNIRRKCAICGSNCKSFRFLYRVITWKIFQIFLRPAFKMLINYCVNSSELSIWPSVSLLTHLHCQFIQAHQFQFLWAYYLCKQKILLFSASVSITASTFIVPEGVKCERMKIPHLLSIYHNLFMRCMVVNISSVRKWIICQSFYVYNTNFQSDYFAGICSESITCLAFGKGKIISSVG